MRESSVLDDRAVCEVALLRESSSAQKLEMREGSLAEALEGAWEGALEVACEEALEDI